MTETSKAPGVDITKGVMNVTKEDQEQINRFARLNARLDDTKDRIANRTNELKNIEDAMAEAEIKILEDEGDKLQVSIGDLLVHMTPEDTQQWLQDKMDGLKKQITELEKESGLVSEEMGKLKANLYAKFGNNIYLETSAP